MDGGTFVLIVPPDEDELARRLHARGSEDGHAAAERLAKAKQEMDEAKASGAYNHVVVNDDLDTAVARVVDIVKQEHYKA